jgi:isoprenylcysteine carboxyl methyltransferase (ICMT) family protein YpbQ
MLDNHHDKILHILQSTSLWTIASGTIGGMYKTIAHPTPLLNVVTVDGTISVATYAFVSAVVGYCTKKVMDYLFQKIKKK